MFLLAAVAASFTDPFTDPFTMCAMVLLFEGAVPFAVFHDRRKAIRVAEERAVDTWTTTFPHPSTPSCNR